MAARIGTPNLFHRTPRGVCLRVVRIKRRTTHSGATHHLTAADSEVHASRRGRNHRPSHWSGYEDCGRRIVGTIGIAARGPCQAVEVRLKSARKLSVQRLGSSSIANAVIPDAELI